SPRGYHSIPSVAMTTPAPLVAVAQVTSTPDKERNFAACAGLVREAAGRGARLVPAGGELGWGLIPESRGWGVAGGDPDVPVPRECGVWLSLGGFHERGQDWATTRRIYNCHAVLDPAGCMVATYRKTHLCDVELEGRVTMKESGFTTPGAAIAAPVGTPAGKLGLCVCYDLRFPEISLALRRAGAEILTYPSAFTVPTGSAHWEV
ncbi:NIT1 amidase, partial [Rhynochetos jubatus]|nr:NIT1 amidase [Rhynochetos jubatus]